MVILLILCSVAVSHGLFWAIVLWGLNHRLSNRLLSGLLILISLRVGKSVVGLLVPGHMQLFASIGVISMAGIGPLLFLFTKSLFNSNFRLRPVDYLHLLPGFLLLIFTLLSGEYFFYFTYKVFTLHLLLYIIASYRYIFRERETLRTDDLRWKWIQYILAGISLLWITFVCQLLFYQPLVYRLILISAALFFYLLSWWAIPRSSLFLPDRKKKNGDSHLLEDLGKRILEKLEKDEVFTNHSLTVTSLASLLKSRPYLISRAINHCYEKSFSELILQYRIRKSEQLLLADTNKALTVEAIASESGFNTLSSFYIAFKKINQVTPSQFREGNRNSKNKNPESN